MKLKIYKLVRWLPLGEDLVKLADNPLTNKKEQDDILIQSPWKIKASRDINQDNLNMRIAL